MMPSLMAALAGAREEQIVMGLDNIWAHDGVGIAISGMGIVFVLLTLISVFISQLPRFMKLLDRFVPENTELQDTGNL